MLSNAILQNSGCLTPGTPIAHATKHDLEFPVWIAEYTLYHHAWDKFKHLGIIDPSYRAVRNAFEADFGLLRASAIQTRRTTVYTHKLGDEHLKCITEDFMDEGLRDILAGMLTIVQAQNPGSATDPAATNIRFWEMPGHGRQAGDAKDTTCNGLQRSLEIYLELKCL
ncbi:uncharacterized protein PHACADRAFT_207459 [Phanerochaete carnosa HHB-10118-sp]|uniref:Uncharacterized protein n=1 Tax=Phanerochaete carnosa (strain HHB-10118-sp) TaxID=650164 RepID=K5WH55_PHACS|nr:uncharacterized protein PHACADRAFT_207459 [Phanerochaete carnosa HHB-10118-sp]EKM58665.1 hypothetical protein PHACADRAFT_207459 [Phanerochaete carnosa HHB-10118-sp]